jgi:hypothetical protein
MLLHSSHPRPALPRRDHHPADAVPTNFHLRTTVPLALSFTSVSNATPSHPPFLPRDAATAPAAAGSSWRGRTPARHRARLLRRIPTSATRLCLKRDAAANPSFAAGVRRCVSGTHHSPASPRHGRLHRFHATALAPCLLGAPRGNSSRIGSGCQRCFPLQPLRLHPRRPRSPLRQYRPLVLLLPWQAAVGLTPSSTTSLSPSTTSMATPPL